MFLVLTYIDVIHSLTVFQSYLRKFALFIHQSQYIHWFDSNQVECFLVINKLNVTPADSLVVVFLLQRAAGCNKYKM